MSSASSSPPRPRRPVTPPERGGDGAHPAGQAFEWRPSRCLCAALVALGALAALSLALSAVRGWAAWPLAAACCVEGVRLSRREGRRARITLRFAADGSARVGAGGRAARLDQVRVRVQGRFAWLTARDARGRVVRLAWWPDTLGPGNARVLRLAAAGAFSPPGRARAASFATMPG